jgi:hypothetical protein
MEVFHEKRIHFKTSYLCVRYINTCFYKNLNTLRVLNFNFIFGHPWWYLFVCIAAGVTAATILYYHNKKEDFRPWQNWLLGAFRTVVITIICLLLMEPLLRMQVTNRQEPVILIFQDNSESLLITADEQFGENHNQQIAELTQRLSEQYRVSTYAFGEQVRTLENFDFQDRITDMSEVFSTIDALYSNRNIGAVIIAGDGIFTRGQNPLYRSSGLLYPVYTIALGDTMPRRDLLISRLQHNRITYLNNIFPLDVTVEARQAAGMRSRLRVLHQGAVIFEQNLTFSSDNHFETIPVRIEATETGIKRFRVEIDVIENEISTANNVSEFFIEVIDSRQKVLIMAASPHPDVGAIKQALDENENYETEVFLIQDFTGNIRDYDMVIWHQLPSQRQNASAYLTQASQTNMPQLFVLGALSDLNAFNRLQTGIEINLRTQGFNDSRAETGSNFTLFQLSPELTSLIPQLPPLSTHFARFNITPATQVLAWQRISNVVTEFPLIAFAQFSERKTGVIAGEGIWRWRLHDFSRNNSHQAFNSLVTSMIQFLAVVEDKSFFRVTTTNFLYENESATFDAELYNASYELVNTPDVDLVITNEGGVNFDYVFARTSNAYRLNAGVFPAGEYRYRARTHFGNEEYAANGRFTVSQLNIEGLQTVADHQLLFQMAENSNGQMYFPNQTEELLADISSRNDIRPVLYSQYDFEEVINLRWLFFLILLLLSVEWFIRKYSGSY